MNVIDIIRLGKIKSVGIPKKNQFTIGILIGLCVVAPFWATVLYFIFR